MKIIQILHDKCGSVMTDTAISCLVGAAVIGIGITTFSAISNKYTLVQTSNSVKRIIETDGKYDAVEQAKIADYINNQHIENVQVTVTPQKDKYNLNEQFEVTLTKDVTLGGGIIQGIDIPIKATAVGSCEVYNK